MTAIKALQNLRQAIQGEGDIGHYCLEHKGEIGKYYVIKSGIPDADEYVTLVELCDLAETYGKSRHWMVKLTGGDAGVKTPLFPEFTIYKFEPKILLSSCHRDRPKISLLRSRINTEPYKLQSASCSRSSGMNARAAFTCRWCAASAGLPTVFPKVFGRIDSLMKRLYADKPTSFISAELPAGRVSLQGKWVSSGPIPL